MHVFSTTKRPQISKEDFKAYLDGPFNATLELLSLPMKKNSLKRKQAAARALQFSCYEELVAQWDREERIRNGMVLESCEVQDGLITVKAKNILFVYEPAFHTFYGLSLRPGEEGRRIGRHLHGIDEDLAVLPLPKGAVLCAHSSMKAFLDSVNDTMMSDRDAVRAVLRYECVNKSGEVTEGRLEFCRTHEGVIVDLFLPDDDESSDSVALMFSDRQLSEPGAELVNLVAPTPVYTGTSAVFYQWMIPSIDCDGDDRLMYINPDEEFSISECQFTSRDEAIEAVESEEYACTEEDLRDVGAVLVETTMRIIKSPY